MNDYVEPNSAHAALLTIDTQQDFTLAGAPAEIPGTTDAATRIGRLLSAFREHGSSIVHVVRLYRADGSSVDPCRRADVENGAEIVRPGSDGAELVDELTPSPDTRLDGERLLTGELQELGPHEGARYKPRWGAFYRTALAEHLDDRGIDTLVVCGCNFPNCPRTTVYEASERDFKLVFVSDATSGTYERGLRELVDIGVAVMDTDETVAWLSDTTESAASAE